MDQGVVVAAEETDVVDDGLAAISPGNEMMDVAPAGRASAPGGNAVTVPGDHRTTETRGDHPGLASNVEHLGAGAEDDPGDRSIARDLPDRLGVQHHTVLGLVKTPCLPAQSRHVDMDAEMRALTTDDR
jgi:hypothetical protein